MKNKNIYILLIIIAIFLGLAFYWFQYLPYEAKIACHDRYWSETDNYKERFEKCMTGFGY